MSARTRALDAPIFGVDVHSGDVRGQAPSYALVVLDSSGIERTVITRRKLLRRIVDEKPDVIATDNIYELAEDKGAFVGLLRSIPENTAVVQVTGAERPEPLSRIAHRHDVAYGKEPMQEAEAAARLAASNVGYEVRAFEDTTRVKVSRGRSTGKGGWSADRYTRRIHGAVKRRTREVANSLDEAGLQYEQTVTEKYGGYANAVFTVEATPSDIPVSAGRSGDVRVEITREQQDGLTFEPLATRRDYVIVGIDPGTTTAVAVVDTDGSVLDVYSTRTDDTAAVIEWIIERGRPFLVAADVTPMPGTVEKIRRSFDATGWTPNSDLLIDRKQHRTRDIGYDNDHQRDAIAAALLAVDDHATQFERIAAKVPVRLDTDEVIARVVGDSESISAVIRDLSPDESTEEPAPQPEPAEPSAERKLLREKEERIERLEEYISQLTSSLEARDEEIASLEAELTETRREERTDARERRTVARLQRETTRLERERERWKEEATALADKLERLKSMWRLDHSNFADIDPEKRELTPIKPVEKFTIDAFETAEQAYGLAPDDVILLRDATGAGKQAATYIADLEPRAVIATGGLTDVSKRVLFENEIPVGAHDTVRIQEVDQLAVAREADVEALIERWEERAADRKRTKTAQLVDQLISEHRADQSLET